LLFLYDQIEGLKGKDKKIEYLNIPSAVRPVHHSDELPVPVPPQTRSLEEENIDDPMETVHMSSESEYEDLNKPHLIAQIELNNLVHDLNLSKAQAELSGSGLKEWNLLQKGTTVSVFHKQQTGLSSYFAMED
jgi:hypothetical protein